MLWTFNACLLIGLFVVLTGIRPGPIVVLVYLSILSSSAVAIVVGWFRRKYRVSDDDELLRRRYGITSTTE